MHFLLKEYTFSQHPSCNITAADFWPKNNNTTMMRVCALISILSVNRDVINFLSCRRKNKSYRRINRLAKRVSHLTQAPRSSGINGVKSCILAFSWHQICCLKYLIFLMDIFNKQSNTHKIFKTWRRYILGEPRRALQTQFEQ